MINFGKLNGDSKSENTLSCVFDHLEEISMGVVCGKKVIEANNSSRTLITRTEVSWIIIDYIGFLLSVSTKLQK